MKPCPVCCKEFTAAGGSRRQRHQKYCGRKCYFNRGRASPSEPHRDHLRLREYLREEPIYCCDCGVLFVRCRIDQITCTPACCKSRNRKQTRIVCRARRAYRQRVTLISRKCEWCREKFVPNRNYQLFCGRVCRDADRRERDRAARATAPQGDLS